MNNKKIYLASACTFFLLGFFVLCYMIMQLFNQHIILGLGGRVFLSLIICLFAYCGCRSLLHAYPERKEEIRKGLLFVCLAIYLELLFIMLIAYDSFGRGLQCIFTASRENRMAYIEHCMNFIPGKTIISYLKMNANMSYTLINLLGNLVVLMPCAIFLPYLSSVFRKIIYYSVAVAGISLGIECLQLVFMCGSADIDDVILNSLGSIFFYFIFHRTKIRKMVEYILWIGK